MVSESPKFIVGIDLLIVHPIGPLGLSSRKCVGKLAFIMATLHSVIEVVHLSSLQRYNIFSVLVEGVGFVPIIAYQYSSLSAYRA
jgi:nucleoside-triphosphatase THEP1